MDQRKRKRMISNRESARRSRMRKQKLYDDLTSRVNQFKEQNNQIATNINMMTHLFLNVEAENSILRAQLAELNQRLQSLNEIISCTNSSPSNIAINYHHELDDFLNPWNLLNVNQSIMASSDSFMY
ncbi:hypothetical protein MTR67_011481 [Solanum verrucosum]|uniref:BZIP domain-containing protein n=1 Tax=Solanum verrucosum TaxID=315347 RepID=A0AAF0TG62_SOLVR|nr:hypothetical protein MTR67_011481 [Solanum verrucosum]